jgi:hypothetical protein
MLVAAQARRLITSERAVEEAQRRILFGMRLSAAALEVERLANEDAHILALAWAADADVRSTDRDYAGAGVATWSTPNLMRALAG